MDGETFREAVEGEMVTELDRLGSGKLLIALTGADLSTDAVLSVAAGQAETASAVLEAWAEDEPEGPAREAFAAVAAEERERRDRIAADGIEPAEPGAVAEYLRGREGTVERVAAGLVGRPLVDTRVYAQIVSFFINEADQARSDTFRECRDDTAALVDRGAGLLDDLCGADDWERARGAAEGVIERAYRDYADTLEGMGVDPKPVC